MDQFDSFKAMQKSDGRTSRRWKPSPQFLPLNW